MGTAKKGQVKRTTGNNGKVNGHRKMGTENELKVKRSQKEWAQIKWAQEEYAQEIKAR